METMKGEGDAEGQRERFGCEFNQSAQGHLVQSVWAAHVSFYQVVSLNFELGVVFLHKNLANFRIVVVFILLLS
mgnify:CR=1 FL=1